MKVCVVTERLEEDSLVVGVYKDTETALQYLRNYIIDRENRSEYRGIYRTQEECEHIGFVFTQTSLFGDSYEDY
jgi:hypothetical protein